MARKHSTEAARRARAEEAWMPGDLQPDELDEAGAAAVRKMVDLAWSGHRPLTLEKPDLDGLSLSELLDVMAERRRSIEDHWDEED